MKNKYTLTREENVFLAKKRWDESIYSGMRMENRNVTFPQTKTILGGINVSGVELSDVQAVLNMRDAWQFLLLHLDDPLTIGFLCKIQERVAFREALEWGELRTGSIGISGVDYMPPIPQLAIAEAELYKLLARTVSATETALDIFAWVTRSQLFWDGNKRTALLAANKVLISNGAGILLVPDALMTEFSTLLSAYYEGGDATALSTFLYDCCLMGIDSDLVVPESKHDNKAKEDYSPVRTSAWLKEKRRAAGVTQKELAQSIGLATNSIANIEQGQRKGSADAWSRIEQFFHKRGD